MSRRLAIGLITVLSCLTGIASDAQEAPAGRNGYYRYPALHGDTIVFTAEGDLWRVAIKGGVAHRITSHPGLESRAAISPDGATIAFVAEYEGSPEVYTMPLAGGLPRRHTFYGERIEVVGWTPDGKVLYTSRALSTVPSWQLFSLDPSTGESTRFPLAVASKGSVDPATGTLYFTRQHNQGSSTKRYKGGTVQNLWKFATGAAEAVPLTADFAGTSKGPMWWKNRVYFISDRDGTMNLWSMDPNGGDLHQLTTHRGWDVKDASLSDGRIAYSVGADLRLYDIAAKRDTPVAITLESDFDQEREKWVEKPLDYLTTVHLSPDGDRLVLTARGRVFVAPAAQGRFVDVSRKAGVRRREAQFLPDGKSLVALSDASGELEFEKLPANGVGGPERLTNDGAIFRFGGVISPDGKRVAYQDKNQRLWILTVETREQTQVAESDMDEFSDLRWSPDSRWLAYVQRAGNTYKQIWLHRVDDGSRSALTSDRVNSSSPAWSPDGKRIYFLSERNLSSAVGAPWGPRQPEPFFNEPEKIYQVSLRRDGRSPFAPADELHPTDEKEKKKDDAAKDEKEAKAGDDKDAAKPPPEVVIDADGLQERVEVVPAPPGNLGSLAVNEKQLFWTSRRVGERETVTLQTIEITNKDPEAKALVEGIKSYELSPDGKKLLIRKGDAFHVIGSDTKPPAKLEKAVDLGAWNLPLNPREEWRQIFVEAWRLMRDYFYDPNMHGVDWPKVRDKYLPLVERVTDRDELGDLVADMLGELSALHVFVFGGDSRKGPDQIKPAGLGARLVRDEAAGGYRVDHIYRGDPDYPESISPLARPGVDVHEGDVIQAINGVPLLASAGPGAVLRNQAGQQVLLQVVTPGAASRDVIVFPVNAGEERNLRFSDWEMSRRQKVENAGKGDIGYVHLRAMGSDDIETWAREFYPVYDRNGLIIDVRNNGGGNIDSWILEKLIRRAWFYWQPRVGKPFWNMQYAFRGHVVLLCNEWTGSDGEVLCDGFQRLGLGKVIGTRTWGGEIWLSIEDWLVDKGFASAPELGVYGPEGDWLIEGHGVDPDIVVDNLPHATFEGSDAQLDAAIKHLQELIAKDPRPVPPAPPHPDKSFH